MEESKCALVDMMVELPPNQTITSEALEELAETVVKQELPEETHEDLAGLDGIKTTVKEETVDFHGTEQYFNKPTFECVYVQKNEYKSESMVEVESACDGSDEFIIKDPHNEANITNECKEEGFDIKYEDIRTDDSDTDCDMCTPPEISKKAETVCETVVPQKSKKIYEKFYGQFMDWRRVKATTSFSENVMLVYFEELSTKLKPPSLWTHYSILKSLLNIKHKIDVTKYARLHALLKRKSEGYSGKKSKTFLPNEIKKFIEEAPDEKYLMTKVALIFGVVGACRRHELHDLKFHNIKDLGETFLVNIPDTKTKKPRTFTITGKYYDVCKKYMNLRPSSCTTSFFLNYNNGKCTVQNIGINKFGNLGKQIAEYLNLPNPNLYTGHCFRRSSATILVDAGGDITTLKRHGGWSSTTLGESYIDSSVQNKMNISDEILNSIESRSTQINLNCPSTSTSIQTGQISQIIITNCTIQNVYIYTK